MDQKPIGVFDSGLGGLTAVRELKRLLPGEDIVYFGDTGRVPYGSRSKDTIIKYAQQDVAFLRTFDLKAIMIACGTVSTTALDLLSAENPIPILGVVEPAAVAAAGSTRNGKIGLIATQASIRSGAYERYIARENPEAQVFAKACPLFVPLVENGRIHRGDVVIETVVAEYLAPLKEAGVDTLVLGCTHYPLLGEVIGDFMGPDVALISAGGEGARAVARRLTEDDALAQRDKGSARYFVSDTVDDFARLATAFLQEEVAGQVQQVDIEKEILNHRLGIRNHAV
ncbi:glutamate racemase [Flavonifractor sp. An92]|uniref:glutamate racemase n=1 Tax=Flavonifractor sp. An92 TaxID=1965666 RepID=UPI000B376C87|nr:glutamate racemase [Flavonifractor sp. An92]OUN06979.1 glutamate racemase [Flavonifractor sp. An92]